MVSHKVKVNLQVGNTSKKTQKPDNSEVRTPSVTSQPNHIHPPKNIKNSDNNQLSNLNHKPVETPEIDNNNNQEEAEETPSFSPINPNSFTQSKTDNLNISEDKIKQVSEQFAKFFKGEIISNTDYLIEGEDNLVSHHPDSKENPEISDNSLNELTKKQAIDKHTKSNELQNKPQKTTIKSKKVTGRPEITENEEDLDF